MKKVMAKMTIQVKASAPREASRPMVSTPTRVQIVKNRISRRPKFFWRCLVSSRASVVMSSSEYSAALIVSDTQPSRWLPEP